nr:MAG: 4-carboxymuconolactone decarboxylase [Mycolicibacterium hassiacum]
MTTTTANGHNVVRRLTMPRVAPEFYQAMIGLDAAAHLDLDPELAELIKIRASQLNHCAFCVDMHTTDARKHGVNEQKLTLLPAWEEAGALYSERERAALALVEEITDLTRRHVSDEVYRQAAAVFSERELGQVIALAATINAWNRIGVTTRPQPPRR